MVTSFHNLIFFFEKGKNTSLADYFIHELILSIFSLNFNSKEFR